MADGFPIRVVRRGGILSGAYPMDDEAIRGLPAEFTITGIRQRRSLPQLRMFWAICQLLAENSEQDVSKETMASYLKVRCGLTETVKMRSGKIVTLPASISFSSLDQSSFHSFMDRVMTFVESVSPGITAEARIMAGD